MAVAALLEADRTVGERTERRPPSHLPPWRRPFVMAALVAAMVFLGVGARTIVAPFGDSHDGRNAGVWAAGGRSLEEHGPIQSRLGARSPENGVYADHPPLLYVETAVAEAIGRGSPAMTRAPAWLASLAVIGLLGALLASAGVSSAAAGAAVALVVGTPMFLVYGTMLDTPVTSLPFGLALLLYWQRTRMGRRSRPAVGVALAVLAVLAGWQSLLVAAVVGAWALARLSMGRGRLVDNAAFAGGAVAGLAVLVGWLLWAFGGSLATLREQFRFRAGQGGPASSMGDLLANQRHGIPAMFGVALVVLAVAGLVVALADPRFRALATVSLLVTLPYTALLRGGAINHDYWDFWFALPLAVGLGAGAHRIVARGRLSASVVVGGSALLAALAALGVVVNPPAPAWAIESGFAAGSVATHARLGPGQQTAWYAGAVGPPASWWGLAVRRPAVRVPAGGLAPLAIARPDDVVLYGDLRCIDGEPRITYAVTSARALAADPPLVARCPLN